MLHAEKRKGVKHSSNNFFIWKIPWIMKIFSGCLKTQSTDKPAGTIVAADENGICVATGDHQIIQITEIQAAGTRKMTVADFLHGNEMRVGDTLGGSIEFA